MALSLLTLCLTLPYSSAMSLQLTSSVWPIHPTGFEYDSMNNFLMFYVTSSWLWPLKVPSFYFWFLPLLEFLLWAKWLEIQKETVVLLIHIRGMHTFSYLVCGMRKIILELVLSNLWELRQVFFEKLVFDKTKTTSQVVFRDGSLSTKCAILISAHKWQGMFHYGMKPKSLLGKADVAL